MCAIKADVDRVILFLQCIPKECGTSLSYIILRGFAAIHNLIMHFLDRVGVRIVNIIAINSFFHVSLLFIREKKGGFGIYDFILIYYTALAATHAKLALQALR